MLEYFAKIPVGFVYGVVKDGIRSLLRLRKRRPLTSQQRIALRQKWKPLFEEHIRDHRARKLREDVIIRDMRRIDSYPESPETRRNISPWFRIGLIDTYHRGIQVGLSWGNLTADKETGEWRFTDYDEDREDARLKVILVGFIPYENIEDVDWTGDEYYGYPHIYCYFDSRKKEPYERVAFCEERALDHIRYYSPVAEFDAVRKLSKRRGIRHFG